MWPTVCISSLASKLTRISCLDPAVCQSCLTQSCLEFAVWNQLLVTCSQMTGTHLSGPASGYSCLEGTSFLNTDILITPAVMIQLCCLARTSCLDTAVLITPAVRIQYSCAVLNKTSFKDTVVMSCTNQLSGYSCLEGISCLDTAVLNPPAVRIQLC